MFDLNLQNYSKQIQTFVNLLVLKRKQIYSHCYCKTTAVGKKSDNSLSLFLIIKQKINENEQGVLRKKFSFKQKKHTHFTKQNIFRILVNSNLFLLF